MDFNNSNTESIEFELDMIRFILMHNPANENLSPEEMDELVRKEFKESRE